MRHSWRYTAAWGLFLLSCRPVAADTPAVDPPAVRAGEIRLTGRVRQVDTKSGAVIMDATSFTLPNGRSGRISPPREKRAVGLQPEQLRGVKVGDRVQVTGSDGGAGQALTAREITLAAWAANAAVETAAGGSPAVSGTAAGPLTLFEACVEGDVNAVKALLQRRPALVDHRDPQGFTPLLRTLAIPLTGKTPSADAALQIARLLLAHGAGVDTPHPAGDTPLMAAAGHSEEWLPVMRLLISKGANVNARDRQGMTVLHRAASLGAVRLLLAHQANPRALAYGGIPTTAYKTGAQLRELIRAGAPAKGTHLSAALDGDGVQVLLEHGVRPAKYGSLSELCVMRDALSVELLVRAGVSPAERDPQGLTPLHLTQYAGAAAGLIAAGVDPNAVDRAGNTPLHFTRYPEVARALLDHGAQLEARNKNGCTPLLRAVQWKNDQYVGEPMRELVALLLARGADVKAEDSAGYAVLDLFCTSGGDYPEFRFEDRGPIFVVRALLDAGAAPDGGNKHHGEFLRRVIGAGRADLARLLLERGADFRFKTRTVSPSDAGQRGASQGPPYSLLFHCCALDRANHYTAPAMQAERVRRRLVEKGRIAELLLEKGLDPNERAGELQATPLHWAALEGSAPVVEALLKHGADANAVTRGRQLEGRPANPGEHFIPGDHTPLYWATQGGHEDVAELLRRHGGRE